MKKLILAILALASMPLLHGWTAQAVKKERLGAPILEDVPIYRDVPVTERVPVYRDVSVTEQVPVYREVPVMKEVPKDFTPKDYSDFRDDLHLNLFPKIRAWGPVLWYHVLGLDSAAGNQRAAIRKKMALLARKTHPDTGGDTANERANQAVTEAAKEALQLPQNAAPLPEGLSEQDKRELERKNRYDLVEDTYQEYDFLLGRLVTKTRMRREQIPGEFEEATRVKRELIPGKFDERPTGRYRKEPTGRTEKKHMGRYEREFYDAVEYRIYSWGNKRDLPEASNITDVYKDFNFTEMGPLTAQWKAFYATKLLLLTAGTAFFKKSEKAKRLKARWKRFKKTNPKKAALISVMARLAYIGGAAVYPLYAFRKIFSNSNANGGVDFTTIPGGAIDNDDLTIFCKVSPGCSVERGTPYAYMKQEDARTKLKPLRQAKVMAALTAAASFASAWMGCAV